MNQEQRQDAALGLLLAAVFFAALAIDRRPEQGVLHPRPAKYYWLLGILVLTAWIVIHFWRIKP